MSLLFRFLLDETDPRAAQLRRQFVFKLIPMLNPDGVYKGHYRTDTMGVNLNRMYHNPSPCLQPTIFAAHQLLLLAHKGGLESVTTTNLFLYVDIHAHATREGFFMYGNHCSDLGDRVSAMLVPALLAVNNPHLVYSSCSLERPGKEREGTGRQFLHRATGLVTCYTLECNYNSGQTQADVQPTSYCPSTFSGCGRSLAVCLLDLVDRNPGSRLASSQHHDLPGLRAWVKAGLEAATTSLTLQPFQQRHQAACLHLCQTARLSVITMDTTKQFLQPTSASPNFVFTTTEGRVDGVLVSGLQTPQLPPDLALTPGGPASYGALCLSPGVEGSAGLVLKAIMMLLVTLKMRKVCQLLLEIPQVSQDFVRDLLIRIGNKNCIKTFQLMIF